MFRFSKREFGKIFLGEDGLDKSWQKSFPSETKCKNCGGNARIGFVYYEDGNQERYVGDIHNVKDDGNKFWPHDAISVATYFCEKCYEPTTVYNQA
jgi:hypothetical protein